MHTSLSQNTSLENAAREGRYVVKGRMPATSRIGAMAIYNPGNHESLSSSSVAPITRLVHNRLPQ